MPLVLVPLVLCAAMVAGVGLCEAQQSTVAKAAVSDADFDHAPWVVDLEKRHAALIARNGLGTDAALRDRLLAMVEMDQNARGISHGQPIDKNKLVMAANLSEIDAKMTAELKEIVAKDGWPTIAMVGIDASNGAMLILTHTADHEWQRSLLPELEELADTGKIDGSSVAVLIDKELVSEGRLQRYGSQFKFVDGAMAMYGVEDPAGLDARRAKVFLMPMDAYKQMLEQMYHLKASGRIVSAAK